MKQSTLQTPQVQRKSIVDNLAQALRVFPQAQTVITPKLIPSVLLVLCISFVFSDLSFAEPRKVADLVGRGLSGPMWSPDSRFMAYTTVDMNELYVVELNEIKAKQSLYRVANLEGVGRRFVFVPGEERIAFRTQVGAISTHPDRIISTSFYTHDNKMLSSNMGPVLGPYRIDNNIFNRVNLTEPLIDTDGNEWPKAVNLDDGELTIRNSQRVITFTSQAGAEVEGFEISPDGEWVAAVTKSDSGRQARLIEISSGATRDLGEGRWPGWSGNSNRIVIIRDKQQVKFAELLVYDLPLGEIRSVVGLSLFWPDEPALNSDGTKVAFTHEGEIYITEVTGF